MQHVMNKTRSTYKYLVGKQRGKEDVGNLSVG